MDDGSCPIERLEKTLDYETASKVWRENVELMLKNCPYTVRVREGGGPESILDSLIVTFSRMEQMLKR